jgi:DinB superfamily
VSNEELVIASALGAWSGNLERAGKFFAGVSAEELQKQVAPGKNRLIYLWGHLAAVNDRMVELLGLGERTHPEFDAVFLSSPDGAAEMPPPEELQGWWTEVNKKLSDGFATLSPGGWLQKHNAVSEEDFAQNPLRNRLAVLLSRTNHLSYHLGQVVLSS